MKPMNVNPVIDYELVRIAHKEWSIELLQVSAIKDQRYPIPGYGQWPHSKDDTTCPTSFCEVPKLRTIMIREPSDYWLSQD